jgi:hypothetical protein
MKAGGNVARIAIRLYAHSRMLSSPPEDQVVFVFNLKSWIMKAKFYLIIIACSFISLQVAAQQPFAKTFSKSSSSRPESATDTWYNDAAAWIKNFEYDFHPADNNSFRVISPTNKVAFLIQPNGYTAYPMKLQNDQADWNAAFSLHSIGRDEPSLKFTVPSATENSKSVLVQHFGFADVEYSNDVNGLRQNFIIYENPGGEGRLRVRLSLQSPLKAKIINGQKLMYESLSGDNRTKLIYEDLKVWDARHEPLQAHMELDEKEQQLSLVVDDRNAVYPVTVDPLNKTPEWTTSADGVLPALLTNLQLQVQTLYGYTVTGLGDINNDGFDDVAVSAPGMANVVSGSGSLLSVGAVFIYQGSAGGLPAAPNHVLQPTVTVAGGLFGLSVSAGEVTGDAFQDIVVGAPLETITLDFGVLGGGVVNGKVGRVYLYSGATLGSAFPASTLSVSLTTPLLTSTTITLNALLGFSVAVTGDMNGDGKGEIIAGAPTYARVSGLANIKTGGAFVYLSNASNTFTTIRSLDPPTGSLLGLSGAVQSLVEALPAGPALWAVASILLNPVLNGQVEGLLFGYSVENAGPYTSDAISDVIVGAPAGLNLGTLTGGLSLNVLVSNLLSGQILGGSAYVFAGNGVTATGVGTASVARLQANPSGLLSNAANLFGYSIRGVEGLTGVKNGNVLVSAPVSSVLSNVVGGLQLKAGTLSVFAKQTGVITSPVAPLQTLSSPRSTSLLTLLQGSGQILNLSLMYSASMDNLMDVNCDGWADIIVGEPLSSNVPLIGANVTGGSAYVYLGKPNGTYQATPVWTLTPTVSPLLGVNATSLIGFSVAGVGHTYGPTLPVRSLVGGPANSLDFGVGLLNLGNTVGTLVSFAADNNGLGKAYAFNSDLCGIAVLPATLLSFKGEKSGGKVNLEWITVDEHELNRYELERSTDGVNFSAIAIVFAKGEQKNTYTYPDEHPVYGNNYYRLRVVDDNGKFSYSNTVVVRFNEKLSGLIAAAPNPARQQVNIRLTGYEKGNYILRLYNTSGVLLDMKKVNLREHQQTEVMNRSHNMPSGVYMVTLHDENNNKVGTVRLIFNEQ